MSFEEYYNSLNSEIAEYFNIIYPTFPTFLIPFIESKSFARLNKVSYFCGAEQGSKSVYNFKYSISRLDHSISTALHVWAKTFDYYSSLAALFHDVTTPALSHVIDYLNKDYLKQESTELDIEKYLMKNDPKLLNFMKSYKLDIDRIFNYKYNSLIDLDRPKLCADRIDFIFLTNLAWTRNITIDEIKDLYNHLYLEINEDGVMEFAVDDYEAAKRIVELNDITNNLSRCKCDYDEMQCLANIVKRLIDLGYIKYEELYKLTDDDIFELIEFNLDDDVIYQNYQSFKYMEKDYSLTDNLVKNRSLNPLVKKLRYTKYE